MFNARDITNDQCCNSPAPGHVHIEACRQPAVIAHKHRQGITFRIRPRWLNALQCQRSSLPQSFAGYALSHTCANKGHGRCEVMREVRPCMHRNCCQRWRRFCRRRRRVVIQHGRCSPAPCTQSWRHHRPRCKGRFRCLSSRSPRTLCWHAHSHSAQRHPSA